MLGKRGDTITGNAAEDLYRKALIYAEMSLLVCQGENRAVNLWAIAAGTVAVILAYSIMSWRDQIKEIWRGQTPANACQILLKTANETLTLPSVASALECADDPRLHRSHTIQFKAASLCLRHATEAPEVYGDNPAARSLTFADRAIRAAISQKVPQALLLLYLDTAYHAAQRSGTREESRSVSFLIMAAEIETGLKPGQLNVIIEGFSKGSGCCDGNPRAEPVLKKIEELKARARSRMKSRLVDISRHFTRLNSGEIGTNAAIVSGTMLLRVGNLKFERPAPYEAKVVDMD